MGDTLKILWTLFAGSTSAGVKKSKFMGMNIGDMRLDMTQDVECIINDINRNNRIQTFEKDFRPLIRLILLYSDSCDFAVLQVIVWRGMWIFRDY